MKVNVYSIQKKSNDGYDALVAEYQKMSKKYAITQDHQLFPSFVAKAALQSEQMAKKSYTTCYTPLLENGFNIALDVQGKQHDSFKFATLLEAKNEVNFFIGGAFGFEKEFISQCDTVISLSFLTMPHKLAHLVLWEQIFRALTINNNHPYHK